MLLCPDIYNAPAYNYSIHDAEKNNKAWINLNPYKSYKTVKYSPPTHYFYIQNGLDPLLCQTIESYLQNTSCWHLSEQKDQYATFKKINHNVGHNHQTFSVILFENILL